MRNDKAIEVLKSECYVLPFLDGDRAALINTALDVAIEAIEAQKIGKWQVKDFHTVFCSECKLEIDFMATPNNLLDHLKHCPNCGTKMEVRNDN